MASLPSLGRYTRQDGYIDGFTFVMWVTPLTGQDETLLTSYENVYHKVCPSVGF